MNRYQVAPVVYHQRPTSKPCDGRRLNNLCGSWKVAVTDEECRRCWSGDAATKQLIIDRAVSAGVDRRREPEICVHFGQALLTELRGCCGGHHTQKIVRFMCTLRNTETTTHSCYGCPDFKKKEIHDAASRP